MTMAMTMMVAIMNDGGDDEKKSWKEAGKVKRSKKSWTEAGKTNRSREKQREDKQT